MNRIMTHTEHFAPTVITTWIFLATCQCLKSHFKIAFTICTNRSICRKLDGRETVKLVSKIGLEHEFPLGTSRPEKKNRTTFSDVPLLPEIFYWKLVYHLHPY